MLKLTNITKIYKKDQIEVNAVDNISFGVNKGEFICIMGQSGSGKTTLLHILGCLHKPTSGKYWLFDQEISTFSDKKLSNIRNKYIGFVFQSFHLLSEYTIIENIELPLVYSGVSEKERRNKTLNIIEKVGLKQRIKHTPKELSGGEQQRVAIARALINSLSLILADEPTGNLDSKTAEEILNIFKILNQEGITIIIVSHNSLVSSVCRRIISLKDGKIIDNN